MTPTILTTPSNQFDCFVNAKLNRQRLGCGMMARSDIANLLYGRKPAVLCLAGGI
jgi:hypothetical protein